MQRIRIIFLVVLILCVLFGNSSALADIGIEALNQCTGEALQAKVYDAAILPIVKAVKGVYAQAQFLIGNCYENGYVVDADMEEAFKWYMLAAEQGDTIGQLNVASCYFTGKGVAQNYIESIKRFMLSEAQGSGPTE